MKNGYGAHIIMRFLCTNGSFVHYMIKYFMYIFTHFTISVLRCNFLLIIYMKINMPQILLDCTGIGGVKVSMLTSSAVDCGFEPRSR